MPIVGHEAGGAVTERTSADTRLPTDQQVVITIDGPAGTGKSTVARLLARRLGLDFLDTGAMYRAAAAITLDHGIDPADSESVVAKLVSADLHFDWTTDPPAMLAWLEPVDDRIREPDVTDLVSVIAANPEVRSHLVRKQRIIAEQHPRLVTEGRDQGSVVFPNAAVKFYLDAIPEVRAARRAAQLREAGHEVDEAALVERIRERDRLDSTRSVGPLIIPEGATIIDTSSMSLDRVVDVLCRASRDTVLS
ncbi:MAG: (d)CMP kinase [Planctomycetota bacterium]